MSKFTPLSLVTLSHRLIDSNKEKTNDTDTIYESLTEIDFYKSSPKPLKVEVEVTISVSIALGELYIRVNALPSNENTSSNTFVNDSLLASYTLPFTPDFDESQNKDEQYEHMACWTSFDDELHHPVLCVLVNRSLLTLCDCIPQCEIIKRDATLLPITDIALPFEADGVFSALDGVGVLLNRVPKHDDHLFFNNKNEKEGKAFPLDMLNDPPRVQRRVLSPASKQRRDSDHLPILCEHDFDSGIHDDKYEGSPAIPSLFTILDPLEEPRPVSIASLDKRLHDCNDGGDNNILPSDLFLDAFERLKSVHQLENSDNILITYHLQRKVHSAWRVHKNILKRECEANDSRANVTELVKNIISTNTKSTAADDALVDFVSGRLLKISLNNSSDESSEESKDKHDDFTADQSDIVVELIWKECESEQLNSPFSYMFMSSTIEGHQLYILQANPKKSSKVNKRVLRCFSIPRTANSTQKSGKPIFVEPCISAQLTRGHGKDATNLLILRRNEDDSCSRLCLYRQNKFIVECCISQDNHGSCIPKSHLESLTLRCESQERFSTTERPHDDLPSEVRIIDITNSIDDRLDLICELDGHQTIRVRAQLPIISSSPIVEAALIALESSKSYFQGSSDLPFMIRLDCARLLPYFINRLTESKDLNAIDVSWRCFVTTILHSFFCAFGIDPQPEDKNEADRSLAFMRMLKSDFHLSYHEEFRKINSCLSENHSDGLSGVDSIMTTYFEGQSSVSMCGLLSSCGHDLDSKWHHVFDTLHLLFEEARLLNSRSSWLQSLGRLLNTFCSFSLRDNYSSMDDFSFHYSHLNGKKIQSIPKRKKYVHRSKITSFPEMPCVMSTLSEILAARNSLVKRKTTFECEAFVHARKIVRFYKVFANIHSQSFHTKSSVSQTCYSDLIVAMTEEGYEKPSDLDDLCVGLALPLREALHVSRKKPSPDWSTSSYRLIGRQDICYTRIAEEASFVVPSSPHIRHLCSNLEIRQVGSYSLDTSSTTLNKNLDKDGLYLVEQYSSMLFPDDRRVHEVAKMLQSSRPVAIRLIRPIEMNDHDFEKRKQEKLALVCRRTLALSVGRGMFTLGTLSSLFAEKLSIPDLCLAGKVLPVNTKVILDSSFVSNDLMMWPQFHNGVATGLRIGIDGSSEGSKQITRAWIKFHKPMSGQVRGENDAEASSSQHSYGGFLMALGLRGHLFKLGKTDVFDCLTTGSVTTIVGVLLGLAANKRSTCNLSISKTLCLHVPSLLPLTFHQMDTSSVIQVAAIVGLGLLYQGSSHRLMTEFLLNEIGGQPTNDNVKERESYKLSCGLALGMVNLRKGCDDNVGLSDLMIEERLQQCIVGGGSGTNETQRQFSRASFQNASGDNESCSCVAETSINTDITAPAAMLAMGLIHFNSGNQATASRMKVPESLTLLEFIRPDLLMIRVIAKSLILWSDVSGSDEWIESQIPKVVLRNYNALGRSTDDTLLRDTAAMEMDPSDIEKEDVVKNIGFVDKQAVRQIYVYITAGACFALGLKFAGTGNKAVSTLLQRRLRVFQLMREGKDPDAVSKRPSHSMLEMCLSNIAVSLGMVMAGSGDLDLLRIFRELRQKCEPEVRYGDHMALGSAIGLLFMGGGSCTLGREPEDIAALLTAFFPRYPSSTCDNQYHLQALRHLYVLAAQRREVEVIDVDSREPIYVPVKIDFSCSEQMSVVTKSPCLVPNKAAIKNISIESDRYYSLKSTIRSNKVNDQGLGRHFTIFAKKKAGHLSYVQDPHALRSLLTQSGASNVSALDLIRSFTEDNRLLGFAQYFCNESDESSYDLALDDSSLSDLCTRILYDCLTNEKPEAVALQMSLLESVALIKKGSISAIWDLKLTKAFYTNYYRHNLDQKARLISEDVMQLIEERIETYLDIAWEDVKLYFQNNSKLPKSKYAAVSAFLVWKSIKLPFLQNGRSCRLT